MPPSARFRVKFKVPKVLATKTKLPLFNEAVNFLGRMAANRGTILFVGTKRAAQDVIKREAQRCGMHYISERWLGGTLTNFHTIRERLKRLEELEGRERSGEIASAMGTARGRKVEPAPSQLTSRVHDGSVAPGANSWTRPEGAQVTRRLPLGRPKMPCQSAMISLTLLRSALVLVSPLR